MGLAVCLTDDDYEAWRSVRLAVEPGSRTHSLEELRAHDSTDRLLLLAVANGGVVGCGIADRAETAGAGFVAPRVLPEHRRRGAGSALLRALAEHCSRLHLATMSAGVEDEGRWRSPTASGSSRSTARSSRCGRWATSLPPWRCRRASR